MQKSTKNGWFNCIECERYPIIDDKITCPKWNGSSRNVPMAQINHKDTPRRAVRKHFPFRVRTFNWRGKASFIRMGKRGSYWPERWRPKSRFMR